MSEMDMAAYRDLIVRMEAEDRQRRIHEVEAAKHERERDQLRKELERIMGTHEVGMIDGKPVLKRTLSQQFAPARFKEQYREIYDTYLMPKLKYELDMDRLRKELPDLVAQFSSTRWTVDAEAL